MYIQNRKTIRHKENKINLNYNPIDIKFIIILSLVMISYYTYWI